MTVEALVNVLDKEVTFEVYSAYNNGVLFDSLKCDDKWEDVKDKTVVEFYPTDTRELYIYVSPDWRT